MVRLSEQVQENLPYPFFTVQDAVNLLGGSKDRRYSIVKRALATGEIMRIRRGLYALAPRAHVPAVNPLALAQQILY